MTAAEARSLMPTSRVDSQLRMVVYPQIVSAAKGGLNLIYISLRYGMGNISWWGDTAQATIPGVIEQLHADGFRAVKSYVGADASLEVSW